MPKKRPQLAKLSRPRLHKPVARERLFRLLDEKREHPVVWIVGPPGAGKTTLVASYLEEAEAPTIWFQVDSGDSDPATFFYYLKQAVECVAARKSRTLPLLTTEYLPDLPGFARRFLREMFIHLPDDIVVVLDNYQDIAVTSELHSALAAALGEIPLVQNFLVLSRSDAPSAYASALLGQIIAVVAWDELRLSPNETELLAAATGITERSVVQELHDQSEGWIAGLTLMLERIRRGGRVDRFDATDGMNTVFDYFAGIMFDRASPEIRETLMKTAYLPQVSENFAVAVTGNPNAIRHIEELHRRHLFTDKTVAQEILYQYHGLFRIFLRNRAACAYSNEARREIARLAAGALVKADRIEDATRLYAEAEDWDATAKLLVDSAAMLLRQGRWQTFEEHVGLLPAHRAAGNPWLQYWLGRSKTFIDPPTAFRLLETAYQQFQKSEDPVGQLLVTSAMLEAIYVHYREFTLMDPWIDRTVVLLAQDLKLPSPEDELWVHSMLLVGASYRSPEHAMVRKSFARIERLLERRFDPNLLVSVASVLHGYGYSTMDVLAEKLAISTARPLLASSDLTAGRAALYLAQEGYAHYVYGRHEQAFQCFDEADALATQHGLHNLALANIIWRALAQRRAGLVIEAEKSILRAEAYPGARQFPSSPISFVKACVAYERGNRAFTLSMLEEAQVITEKSGSHISTMLVRLVSASILIDCGAWDAAASALKKARSQILGPITEHYLGAILLNESWLEHCQGNFEKRDFALRLGLQRSTESRTRARLRWYPKVMSEILPLALEHGIEPRIAIDLAREFKVSPGLSEVEDWPWPIKIYTFGRFELLMDSKPAEYSRKAPKKVLSLLKAIIAYGPRPVGEQLVLDTLWPDEEGDASRRSLNATLHRLRSLLGDGRAIVQAGGKLALNQQCCWVDARAFVSRLERAGNKSDDLIKAVALYRGAFLLHEESNSWIVPAREHLRAKFIHAVAKLASILEQSNQYEAAIDLFLRGIEADNLIEPFYQGLMRCYDRMNRRAEAVSVYRRLRETLSITLGVQPSAASRRLLDSLRAG